jgi:hypothetical protein
MGVEAGKPSAPLGLRGIHAINNLDNQSFYRFVIDLKAEKIID